MNIWKRPFSIETLNSRGKDTLVDLLGIQVSEVGDDFLRATMPVDKRTHQPMGILHGGASIALAETVGSMAANLAVSQELYCVGLDINGNHLKSVRTGIVTATARSVHIGRSTHVWEILITDEDNNKICVSRLTMAVLSKREK